MSPDEPQNEPQNVPDLMKEWSEGHYTVGAIHPRGPLTEDEKVFLRRIRERVKLEYYARNERGSFSND